MAADARDQAAAVLDRDLEERDAAWAADGPSPSSGGGERANANRDRAATERSAAAKARNRAAKDRQEAAEDRRQAAEDRLKSQGDRDALLHELAVSEMDGLTGARARVPGLADLDHEIARARRTTGLLAIAYVDIVGLKVVNDEHGHSAGDELLKDAVRVIRGHLRSYDTIVRVGGDEFVCVMSGAAIESARQRFEAVQAALATDSSRCEIKVGIAALGPEDSASELIDRADAALAPRRNKSGVKSPGPRSEV